VTKHTDDFVFKSARCGALTTTVDKMQVNWCVQKNHFLEGVTQQQETPKKMEMLFDSRHEQWSWDQEFDKTKEVHIVKFLSLNTLKCRCIAPVSISRSQERSRQRCKSWHPYDYQTYPFLCQVATWHWNSHFVSCRHYESNAHWFQQYVGGGVSEATQVHSLLDETSKHSPLGEGFNTGKLTTLLRVRCAVYAHHFTTEPPIPSREIDVAFITS